MFKKLMNSYYYGKAGKGDLTTDDLPSNRWQLFLETLRVRFSALIRLNLMHVLVWLPCIIVLILNLSAAISVSNQMDLGDGTSYQTRAVDAAEIDAAEGTEIPERQPVLSAEETRDNLKGILFTTLLFLFPCIAITGPATAGVSYVTRNWARDEHAFIWSDFKDAVKENWKQSLVVSVITGAMPLVVYTAWTFYGDMATRSPLAVVPQVLVLMLGIIWALAVTYMHPLIVSYRQSLGQILRNAVLLAVARLPMSIGIRLLHMVPLAIFFLIALWGNTLIAIMVGALYYVIIGFSLSRFITASYTNGVFDRFINARIEGAKVNRGLRAPDNDEDDEEEPEE